MSAGRLSSSLSLQLNEVPENLNKLLYY